MVAPSLDDFRRDAAAWLAANAAEAPRDYGAIVPAELVDRARAWQARLADAGWAGVGWPETVGGRGLTAEHAGAWLEEAARAAVPPFLNMVGFVLMGGTVLAWGTPEQQAEHLPPTLRGDRVWCQLFSEPDAGSDLASLATRAERDGDCFVVTGQKVWCSNGRVADWGILLARTDPDVAKHKGISFFLLDMTLPGIELRPLRQMTGESEFDEVFLDEVRVPADCLVGPLHGGWGVAMSTLTNERGHIGASVISLGRRLDELAATAAGDAVGRDRLVRLLSKGRAFQYLGGRQGPTASTAASLMKLGISELSFDLADASGDPSALLSAPAARIAGGTSEVQRNIIGELLLGLPKEPRPS
jgi:alkylation response protein AidB-like acyl-CoA dehydrogenase